MKRRIYEIQLKSLKAAIEHLRTLDLQNMAEGAALFGTDADRALIQGVIEALPDLAPDHGHP
jgi:hypothetical protein